MLAEDLDLLTKVEAAEKLRVSPSTVDRLRAQGEIAWVPVGRQIRFRAEALADYVKRRERRAAGEPEFEAPRARALPAPAPGAGPRRRVPAEGADFDELFPITVSATASRGSR